MFSQPNSINLDDFIEKPAQECSVEELKTGNDAVLKMLDTNPSVIMNIIANHPFIPASFLLAVLIDKMKSQNSIEKLGILFDKCSEQLIGACVYNTHDLARCIEAMPSYSQKIIENILSRKDVIERILNADNNPEETLKKLVNQYPNYRDQLTECFNNRLSRQAPH